MIFSINNLLHHKLPQTEKIGQIAQQAQIVYIQKILEITKYLV